MLPGDGGGGEGVWCVGGWGRCRLGEGGKREGEKEKAAEMCCVE